MSLNPTPPFVLVVEDDQGCSELITEVVTDLGYQVIVRDNAEEAQTLLGEQRPLLVILDIMLPDADGFSVLRSMRENPDTATTPVMLCTAALFEVSEFHNPIIDPHTEIMPKPFHIEVFVSVMERLIAGR